MKWFFLLSFVAALICSVLWTTLIIFAIASSRLKWMGIKGGLALAVPLVFFIWGAREMFRSFKGIGLDE